MPATNNVNQVGPRLDIADIIAVADMRNTPFATMVAKTKQAQSALFSNQADAYDDPKIAGAIDGQDVKEFEDGAKHRGLISGRVKIFERTAMVTTVKEAVANRGGIAAVKSEFARSKAKKAIEFKRDQEATFLGDQDSAADTGAAAGQTRGVGAWISATAQGDQPVPSQFLTPSGCIYGGTAAAFDEAALRGLLQARYEQVGLPQGVLVALCGTAIKNIVSDFSRYNESKDGQSNVRFYQNVELTKVRNTVDMYEGDYGEVEFHLDNFLPDQKRAYVLDMDYWDQYFLKNPTWTDLQNEGGGPRALLQGILGLLCENPKGQIKIAAT